MKDRKALLLGGIALLFVLTAVGVLVHAPDPLAQYRTASGGLSIPGGQLTPELQRLLFPPPAPKTYMTFAVKTSSYPTVAFVGTSHDIPQIRREDSTPVGHPFVLPDFAGIFRQAASAFFSLFTMNGAAACTWSNGGADGKWSTAANWNGCGGLAPQLHDDVVFDATSSTPVNVDVATNQIDSLTVDVGYGSTVTVNINQVNTWGNVAFSGGTTGTLAIGNHNVTMGSMTMAAGTLTIGSGTITLNGNWDSSAGTFTSGTSTVVTGADSTLVSDTTNQFWNFTIGLGTSVQTPQGGPIGEWISVKNVFTVNGTWLNSPGFGAVMLLGTNPNPIVLGVGATLGTDTVISCLRTVGFNLAAGTYSGFALDAVGTNIINITQTGNVVVAGSYLQIGSAFANTFGVTPWAGLTPGAGDEVDWLSSGHNLTISGGSNNLSFGPFIGVSTIGALITTTGTASVATGSPIFVSTNAVVAGHASHISFGSAIWSLDAINIDTLSYLNLGSADITITGTWANASTSASWSAGTGTINFTKAGAQTIGGTGTKNIFNTVIVSGAGSVKSFTQNFTTSDFTAGTGSPTVQVTAGKTWTFTGDNIGGATITFRSSASGTPWFIAPTLNSPTARYVSVSDSTATGNNVVAYFSNDLGGNTGWLFVGGATPPPAPMPQPQPQPQQPGTIPIPFSGVSVDVSLALFALVAISALTLIGASALHVPLGRRTKATFVVLFLVSAVAFAFTVWHA